jgi:hypothetical protein
MLYSLTFALKISSAKIRIIKMNLEERIQAFARLGTRIKAAIADDSIEPVLAKAQAENGWFTTNYSRQALSAIANEYLNQGKLRQWLSKYHIRDNTISKVVGLVPAGNIPLVGFHDILSILLSGHHAAIKLSSKDAVLTKWIMFELSTEAPELSSHFAFVDRMNNIDAVIATGSDNTSRYFEYYFGRYPHIIRRNRNSVAVLSGDETREELKALSHDIFDYYGLGCRNVSKLYVPKGYEFSALFEELRPLGEEAFQNNKYRNNYDYHKSILLLNREPHLDAGFLLIKPETSLASPVASVYYEEYDSITTLRDQLSASAEKLQCIVARENIIPDAVPFGQAQCPAPCDYADGVDTMKFLLTL